MLLQSYFLIAFLQWSRECNVKYQICFIAHRVNLVSKHGLKKKKISWLYRVIILNEIDLYI